MEVSVIYLEKEHRVHRRTQAEHVERLRSESKRNQQLEKKLVELTSENAQRLSSSETQMADLSEQIGVIEKQR